MRAGPDVPARLYGSFRQDQLVLHRQSQSIGFVAMADDDFARPDEDIAAVDAVVHHRNPAHHLRNSRALRIAIPRVFVVGGRAHLIGGQVKLPYLDTDCQFRGVSTYKDSSLERLQAAKM